MDDLDDRKDPPTDLKEHTDNHDAQEALEVQTEYKLYRRRFVGCIALGLLNVIGGMNWLWFSAIALNTAETFNISVSRVNWLSNIVNFIYLPVSFLLPWIVRRFGTRNAVRDPISPLLARCSGKALLAALCFLVGAWLRYCGTIKGMTRNGAYATLLLGQLFAGVGQPFPQILAASYSEAWFGLKGRVTATMVISLMNPVGSALAQLLSPLFNSVKTSLTVAAIITSAICPLALLVKDAPPTPPTFAGSQETPPVLKSVRSALGCPLPDEACDAMTARQRLDFAILTIGFGIVVGVISAFSILISQIYEPYGWSDNQAGLVGAALFISGLVGAIITAPIFDRYLTHRLGMSIRLGLPVASAAWIGLIWASAASKLAPSYVLVCVAGFISFTLLPVTIELACEVTSSTEMSSSALWFSANLFTVLLVLVADDLRAGPNASPPDNMQKVLILFTCIVSAVALSMIGLQGRQARRERDEEQVRVGET